MFLVCFYSLLIRGYCRLTYLINFMLFRLFWYTRRHSFLNKLAHSIGLSCEHDALNSWPNVCNSREFGMQSKYLCRSKRSQKASIPKECEMSKATNSEPRNAVLIPLSPSLPLSCTPSHTLCISLFPSSFFYFILTNNRNASEMQK